MRIGGEVVLRGGAMLEPVETATTVRVRDGKRMVTDGPFAETAEQIAGIAIVELDDLDDAIEWAAGHPDAEWASVEIRPIMPWGRGRAVVVGDCTRRESACPVSTGGPLL